MKILLVSIYDVQRSGGLSSHVAELGEELVRTGHDVRTITPYTAVSAWRRRLLMDVPRVPLRLFDRNAAYRHFLDSGRVLARKAIAAELARGEVQIVHAHDPTALLAARDAVRLMERQGTAPAVRAPRLVLTVHGDIANMAVSDGVVPRDGAGHAFAEGIEREAFRVANQVLAVDARLTEHCAALGERTDVVTFPNFVDTRFFHPLADLSERIETRARFGIARDARLIVVPRRLVAKNGVIFAVRAMAKPLWPDADGVKSRTHVVLAIAGSGPEQPRIALESRSTLGVGVDARMLGDLRRDLLAKVYRASDVVLIPSIPHEGVIEATSISALEAMASGVPLVASAIGGLRELVRHESTGLLIPPGDAGAIAVALRRLIGDDDLRSRLGSAARKSVEGERSSRSAVDRISQIYVRICESP